MEKYLLTKNDIDNQKIDEKYNPLVTFAIPTYNNERTIGNALKSILDQNYEHFEIIIIDGYSKDKTIKIINSLKNKTNKPLQIFKDKGKLGKARQIGIDKANGEIIALFDSDLYIPRDDWLKNAIKYFSIDKKIAIVWPLNNPPNNAKALAKCHSAHAGMILEDRMKKNRGVFGGGNALFRTKYLREVGGISHDIHWGEDFEVSQKIKKKGYRVFYLEDPLIHDNKQTLKEYLSKQEHGSDTFIKQRGLYLMDLSLKEVIYEQYIIGLKGMFIGLKNKKIYWFMFPFLMVLKSYSYGRKYIKKNVKSILWK